MRLAGLKLPPPSDSSSRMWIMLWLFMSTSGSITSGAVEFPTKEACLEARKQWVEEITAISEQGGPGPHPYVNASDFRCLQRASGKP